MERLTDAPVISAPGAAAPAAPDDHPQRDRRLLTLIGTLKLLKAATLVALGIGLLGVMNGTGASPLARQLSQLRPSALNHLINAGFARLDGMSADGKALLDAATFAYAALFAVEGIGLILAKHWAEWLTVVTTSGLIPFEIYEIAQRRSPLRIALLVANMVIVIYLIVRIRRDRRAAH